MLCAFRNITTDPPDPSRLHMVDSGMDAEVEAFADSSFIQSTGDIFESEGRFWVRGCQQCFTLWRSASNKILAQGCWYKEECDSSCTSSGSIGGSLQFCCCSGDACNQNFSSGDVEKITEKTFIDEFSLDALSMDGEDMLTYALLGILAGLLVALVVVIWRISQTCDRKPRKSVAEISSSQILLVPADDNTTADDSTTDTASTTTPHSPTFKQRCWPSHPPPPAQLQQLQRQRQQYHLQRQLRHPQHYQHLQHHRHQLKSGRVGGRDGVGVEVVGLLYPDGVPRPSGGTGGVHCSPPAALDRHSYAGDLAPAHPQHYHHRNKRRERHRHYHQHRHQLTAGKELASDISNTHYPKSFTTPSLTLSTPTPSSSSLVEAPTPTAPACSNSSSSSSSSSSTGLLANLYRQLRMRSFIAQNLLLAHSKVKQRKLDNTDII